MMRQTIAEKSRALRTGSQNAKAEDAPQHHRVTTTTNAERTAVIIALHDMTTAKKTTMNGIVMIGAVVAIAHAVHQLIPSTAAVAATRRSTVLHARTAIAARNTVAVTGRAHLLKRASTTTTHMLMATETQSLARGASTEAIRTGTVTDHATRIASETGATVKNERKTTTTTARKIGRETRIRSASADATARQKRKDAITMTTSIVHHGAAARTAIERIAIERTAGAMNAARTSGARAIVTQKSSVPQKTM